MLSFGMRCHDICPKMPMEELFQEVRANQIDQIQLAFGKSISDYDFSVGHYSPGFGRYIASLLEKNQIHVAVLGCYINPIHPIESRRQAEVARFIEHMKYARIIGADMREIVSAAEKLGVTVGVEGVFDHTLYSPAMMKRFLEDIDSPNVEVILDSVNLIHPDEVERQEEVIDKAFAYYGDRITMLHMKDFVFDGSSQIFRHVGEGLFQYEPLMKHLKEKKPHITMLLENSNKERYHSDVEFLKEIYDRV